MKVLVTSLFALFVPGWLVGCTTYEYEITQPVDLSQHIGGQEDATFRREPLEYRLRSVENRLVMRIYNHTPDSMTLVGERSFAVDESGQSHPLRTVTLAPQSFIKLILPPPPPVIERTGPSIGIGIGGGFGDARRRGYPYDPEYGFYGGPRYFTVYDDHQFYWDWKGDTEVRLTLVFDRGGTTFQHDYVIKRKKM
jgi:hypothetical protein